MNWVIWTLSTFEWITQERTNIFAITSISDTQCYELDNKNDTLLQLYSIEINIL